MQLEFLINILPTIYYSSVDVEVLKVSSSNTRKLLCFLLFVSFFISSDLPLVPATGDNIHPFIDAK